MSLKEKAKIDYDEKLYEKFRHLKSAKKHLPGSHISKQNMIPHGSFRIWNKKHPSQRRLLECEQR